MLTAYLLAEYILVYQTVPHRPFPRTRNGVSVVRDDTMSVGRRTMSWRSPAQHAGPI